MIQKNQEVLSQKILHYKFIEMTKEEKLLTTNPESPASRYKNLKEKFTLNDMSNYSTIELMDYYDQFDSFYCIFFDIQTEFYKEYISVHEQEKKDYLDLASTYASQIQNIYLNRINNELNQRNTDKNLRSAKKSISLGWWSVGLGGLSAVLAVISVVLAIITIVAPNTIKNLFSNNESSCERHTDGEHCSSLRDSTQSTKTKNAFFIDTISSQRDSLNQQD